MKYHFKSGRGKKVVINGNDTFERLGYEMLRQYHIDPEHLYCLEFVNGDVTNSAAPFGTIDDWMSNVSIKTKIKDRKLEIGEEMILVYDYSRDWRKKIKLDKIE